MGGNVVGGQIATPRIFSLASPNPFPTVASTKAMAALPWRRHPPNPTPMKPFLFAFPVVTPAGLADQHTSAIKITHAKKIGLEKHGRPAPLPFPFTVNHPIDAKSPTGQKFKIYVVDINTQSSLVEYTQPK